MPKPPKPGPSYCPNCYLFDGVEAPLTARVGSNAKCERGHVFDDMEDLERKQDMARHKREQIKAAENPGQAPAEVGKSAVVDQNTGTEITISQDDRLRLSNLLGPFTDGSSLYGSVFSLMQDLKNSEEMLKLSQKTQSSGAAQVAAANVGLNSGGELPITILVPERHVQPLKDISEANGTNTPDYMQAAIANGLDSGWFY